MKKLIWALIAAVAVAPAVIVHADDPTVNILSPSGVQYVSSFPASAVITVQVSHPSGQLSDLNVFDIRVAPSGSSTYTSILTNGELGNPFPGNACSSSQMVIANGITGCSIAAGVATVSAAWQNISAGTHSIQLVIRHRSDEGMDTETVTFQLVSLEHPAPPAVANAYIKTIGKLQSKIHGCVISQIAERHAKYEAYGPKGGPYNEAAIQADVNSLIGTCSGS